MLRANIETIINNSPYSEPVNGFLFGFSSTFIGIGTILIVILIAYDYYRFDNRSIVLNVYKKIFGHAEFILPLYHRKIYTEDISKKDDGENSPELTEKPDLTAFIIPGITIEPVIESATPISTGLKRRIGSESPFLKKSMTTNSLSSATASSMTPTKCIDPFDHEFKAPVASSV